MKTHKPSRFTRSKIALATTCALLSSHAFANTLEGRITDANNSVYFEGAKISIKELNRTISSERDGRFRLTNLPAGQYTLVVDYLGAKSVERQITIKENEVLTQRIALENQDAYIEDVIVVGQRAGQAGALNRQKNAMA